MRPRSLLLLSFLLLLPADPAGAQASPSYELTIESPGGVAAGSVVVRVRVSGGVRDAKQAAFHLRRDGSWQDGQRIQLTRTAEDLFETTMDTTLWENASYRLEARVWGDVPPYDASDPRTFARAIADVAIDNRPAPPQQVQAVSPSAALRVGWSAVATADRPDFLGYRVLSRRGKECPADPAAYRSLGTIDQLLYVDMRPKPGRWCLRVASVRFSAVTGEIASEPSAPVRVVIDRSAGGALGLTGDGVAPPPPPVVGEGTVDVSDGAFAEDLPYDAQTVTEAVPGEDGEVVREAGVDPRRTPTLLAAGLVLGVAALLIRRFLTAGRMPA